MKKRFCVLAVALTVIALATACGSSENKSTPIPTASGSQNNGATTPTAAGSGANNEAQITATSAPTEIPTTPTPSVKEYTISEYLKTGETIWFGVQEYISKSSHVTGIYIFESDGTYRAAVPKKSGELPTLGELSQMSDQEIIKLVDDYLADTSHFSFNSYVLTEIEYNIWADYILKGEHKYAFSYFTDFTGNNINYGMLWLEEMVPMAYYYKDLNAGGDFVAGSKFAHNVINRFVVSKFSAGEGMELGHTFKDQIVYQADYMGFGDREGSFMLITKNPGNTQLVLDSDMNNGFLIDKGAQDIFEERVIFDTNGHVSYGLKCRQFCYDYLKEIWLSLEAYSKGYGSLEEVKGAVNCLDRDIFTDAEVESVLSYVLANSERILSQEPDFYNISAWEWFCEMVFKAK